MSSVSTEVEVRPARLVSDPEALAQTFRALADRWRQETLVTSSTTDMVLHPAYQRIIGLGPAVLPLLFHELQERPGHWFWALAAITGANPVSAEDAGHVPKMREAWLALGRQWGYL
jgi:hypothetical protein